MVGRPSNSAAPPPGPPRVIAGGFVLVPACRLLHAWQACHARPLGAADFRAYLACLEVAHRRQPPADGRAPRFTFAEPARLLGVAERRARASVGRLAAAGLLEWSESAVAFPGPPGGPDDGLLAETIGGGRGDLAVPRRLLRFLAKRARPALVAAALGLLLRCLSRRKGGFDGRGRAKASWIARAFGVDPRAVKAARQELVNLGWAAPEPSPQAAENRWGRAYRIDLAWAGPPAPAGGAGGPVCRESPPPGVLACRESPPPLINQDPLRERIRNQDPAPGGPAGVEFTEGCEGTPIVPDGPQPPVATALRPRPQDVRPEDLRPPAEVVLSPPRLRDIRPEDLRDPARVLELHRQAAAEGLIGSSEADRLKFAAAAEHARAVGTVNPGGLFARLVGRGWWHFATQGDEDAAARRLKRHLYGDAGGGIVGIVGVVGPRPTSPARAALSADAAMVCLVRAAVARAGGRADPFPLVRAKDPSWTRERWDRALAELVAAAPRPLSEVVPCSILARPGSS